MSSYGVPDPVPQKHNISGDKVESVLDLDGAIVIDDFR